ncbi:glycosyl hydrolase [Diplocarpon rosae]|nr:glycosyl hydrolase [Diplocarpon rosae]
MLPSSLIALLAVALTLSHAHPAPQSLPEPQFFQIGDRHLTTRVTKNDYVAYAVAGINQMHVWYDAATGLWQNAFNGFYDDELWWVLAWIKVYDVTKDITYLNTATAIFEDSKKAWGATPCGGLWWDKAHTSVGAVENELYLTAAAKLANRLPHSPSSGYYFNEALKAYEWFINSGLINEQNVINNGLDLKTCKNDGTYVFSYNQGIILSGLAEMTWSTGDTKYNELANTIALAAMKNLTNANGILTDPCDRGCNSDTEQFKGIFGRGIHFLVNRAVVLPAATRAIYVDFLKKNADSIWAYSQVNNQLGLVWSGPKGPSTIQTQSSALDAIVGAACVS